MSVCLFFCQYNCLLLPACLPICLSGISHFLNHSVHVCYCQALPPSPLTRSTTKPVITKTPRPREAPVTSRMPLQDSFSLSRPTYSSMLQEQEYDRVDSTLQEAHLYRLAPDMGGMWTDLLRGRLRPDTPNVPSRSAALLRMKLRELRDRAVLIFFAINGTANTHNDRHVPRLLNGRQSDR